MAVYYIDPSQASNGTGTPGSPFNSPASAPAGAGNRYRFKRGTTWPTSGASAFPAITGGVDVDHLTVFEAYANADGSDNTTQPLPIINLGDNALPADVSNVMWYRVRAQNAWSTEGNDKAILTPGNGVVVLECEMPGNLGAIKIVNRTGFVIQDSKFWAATGGTSFSMSAILVDGTSAMSGIIDGNEVYVGDGGTSSSHAVRISSTVPFASLQVTDNRVRTQSGIQTTNATKAGVFISNALGSSLVGPTALASATVVISGNDVSNLGEGVYLAGVRNAWIHHNTLSRNGTFGLHLTGGAIPSTGNIIEWNRASHCGVNASPFLGRGIELSGTGIQGACSVNVVRFNYCGYSANWGGTADDGSEGVGIGLSGGANGNLVYANMLPFNEGAGISVSGGATANTGGNALVGNAVIGSGARAFKNVRSGTKYQSANACGIRLANLFGSKTTVYGNLLVGGFGGVRREATCSNVTASGNAFVDQTGYAIAATSALNLVSNFYKPGIQTNIADLTLDGNGAPIPALVSAASNESIDPLIGADYLPLPGSPLLALRNIPWSTGPVLPIDTDPDPYPDLLLLSGLLDDALIYGEASTIAGGEALRELVNVTLPSYLYW